MEAIDWGSEVAQEVLTLNKGEVRARLIAAVRDSQVGAEKGNACWAPSARPEWWIPELEIKLGTDEVLTLPFVSRASHSWATRRVRVTLLLYEFRSSIRDAIAARPSAAASSEPQVVPESQSRELLLIDNSNDYTAEDNEDLVTHCKHNVEQVDDDDDWEGGDSDDDDSADIAQSSKAPRENIVEAREDSVAVAVRRSPRNTEKRERNVLPSSSETQKRPTPSTAGKSMDENQLVLGDAAVSASSSSEHADQSPLPAQQNVEDTSPQQDMVATILQTVTENGGNMAVESFMADEIRKKKNIYTKSLQMEEMELALLKEAEEWAWKRIERKRIERERLKVEIDAWEIAVRENKRQRLLG